jgi:hypothetical protein
MEIGLIMGYAIIVLWNVLSVLYGLYLSRRNNRVYNEQIVQLLKDIKELLQRNGSLG